MVKIKKQYEKNGYLIIEYENGTQIVSLITEEVDYLEPPFNPLLKLEKENEDLKKELGGLKLAIAELSKMKEV